MPDWEALVSARLGELGAEENGRAEIVRELAGHLEDAYVQRLAHGLTESAAAEETLAAVKDWEELARQIRLAKVGEGGMNERTRGYWLPGLVCVAASMAWLMILERSLPDYVPWYPKVCLAPPHAGMTESLCAVWETQLQFYTMAAAYLLWLLTLPIFGALGAFLSRSWGGGRNARLFAGVLPALLFLFALGILGLVTVFVREKQLVFDHPLYFWKSVVPWVIFPALALGLGVLPFLRRRRTSLAD